jgi:SAM-dependent methyltransferase
VSQHISLLIYADMSIENSNLNHRALFPGTGMPDKDWWHALWPDPDADLRAVGIEPGMGVVDLCCGDGYFTNPMCQRVDPGITWAVDLDDSLLQRAALACVDNTNFRAILGDARDLPELVGVPVDFVFIANTFHGVPDKTALSKAVHQRLNPAGRFAIINWYRRPREETVVLGQPRGPGTDLRMQPTDVRAVVEPVGFKEIKLVDVGPYHYGIVFQKV